MSTDTEPETEIDWNSLGDFNSGGETAVIAKEPEPEPQPDFNHPHYPYEVAEHGRYTRGTDILFFDLETVPDHARSDTFNLEEPPTLSPVSLGKISPDNFLALTLAKMDEFWSDPSEYPCEEWCGAVELFESRNAKPREGVTKLLKKLRDRREQVASAADDRRKLLSITPEYCRIVAVAIARPESPVMAYVDDGRNPEWEKLTLQMLWESFNRSKPICGFNSNHFDLPTVFVRSAVLRVPPSRRIDLTPWKGDSLDLYKARFPNGKPSDAPGKLKQLAKLYNIDVPAGDCDGSQVEEIWKSDHAKLREYVASDLEITRELWRKWRGYFC